MKPLHSDNALCFRPFFLVCGLLLAASEIWKQLYLTFGINGGCYDWWYFPFQLCSTPMYVQLLLPHLKKGRLCHALLTFLMCYGTLGGIAAFADTSGMHYPALSLTVHSYLWHILQILTGILAGFALFRGPGALLSRKAFGDASLLYLAFCAMASLINFFVTPHAVINMFYINPRYPMEQVVFCRLVPYIGNNAAILAYMGATVLGAGIFFCFYYLTVYVIAQPTKK